MSGRSSLRAKLISSPYVVWSALFIVAPLIFVVYYSFTNPSGDFTLDNISALSKYAPTFLRSIWFGIVATVICLLIAFPLAYIISQKTEKVQRTLVMLVMLPMWMSFLIRTYSWMALLQDTGIINSFLAKLGIDPIHMINTSGAVILGMVYNFLPYMIMPIYSVMAKLDYSMVEAAQDLGGNRLTVIKRCIIPMSMPGVISGITMVFVPSVSTFYISQKLGGGSFDLIGDVIERQFQQSYNYNLGASLSLVLMVLILICMAVMNRFSGDEEGMVI
ncbi:aBC transporter permease protein [Clostridium sp. CAG:413]|jgi:spermidine/putrescine transport system permease protein|nr:aBC transporter permease protein [Clostridium sp. CAG:413]